LTAARTRCPRTTVASRSSLHRGRVRGWASCGTWPRAGRRLWRPVLGLILLWGAGLRALAEEVVVAVNPATPAGATITRNTLSAIFGMRLRAWADGTPVRVYVLPDDNAVHVAFSKEILMVFPHQLRTAWDRLVFSGTGQAPLEVADEEEMRTRIAGIDGAGPEVVGSEEEMREKLARNAGAIGYLSRKMIDERVAVLPVD
jgi:ABC-type phosphate transport system substrate-binding protein